MNKLFFVVVIGFLGLFGTIVVCKQFAHKLENQDQAIVQSMTGNIEVRKRAGWWLQICPTITKYNKAGMYRLNSADNDSLKIQFNNKSTATLNAAIGYRIDNSTDEQFIALHQQVEGNDEKIWQMVLTALNTAAQSITTKYDPSSVIGGENFELMVKEIYAAIMHNSELLAHGIDVNYFAVDGRPIPDKDTEIQFNKQKEADLARRLANAEKIKLEAEKVKVEAEYARQIAEQKGQAEAQMAKDVQSAEREKKLATIAAQKQVEVAQLEKERAEIEVEKQKRVAQIEAEKLLAVAEVQKKTEAEKLEAIRIQAEQKIVTAEARKKEIELSGAITEQERVRLEIEKETKIGVAAEQAKTYAHWNPQVIQVSGGNGQVTSSTSALDNFLNMEAAKAALEMTSTVEQ